MDLYTKLLEQLKAIPLKTKFLADIGLKNSYTGFRYFVNGRNKLPSKKFMEVYSEKLGYDFRFIPVKKDSETEQLIKDLEDRFLEDSAEYLKKYSNDKKRVYATKEFGNESVLNDAISSFEEDLKNSTKKIDISDLFN